MDLYKKVALKYFDQDADGSLNDREEAELLRVKELNKLSLIEFRSFPAKDQEIAEELWTADILDRNLKLLQDQTDLRRLELSAYRSRKAKDPKDRD
ncbi:MULTISPECIES: hypothetical protein [unclassified Bradyrhizobium]|uniref:hypothetical protein n=1 Tax=unclassified Bradyrhizobium TaxID=2631580 RepID=UPI0028E322AA|nr:MULTISPECIES: hypothetical protein [unclassified Bradyrhizobium]